MGKYRRAFSTDTDTYRQLRPDWPASAAVGLIGTAASSYAQIPTVSSGGVVNNGSHAALGVAPGSTVAIFGSNLASGISVAEALPLPLALDTKWPLKRDAKPFRFDCKR